jgi:hypothetical protein
MKIPTVLLIVVIAAFSALALTAPFGYGWFRVPAEFRIALLGFFANLMLVGVTWVYVLITRDQLRELQSTREPKAVLNVRVPQTGIDDVHYGKGNHEYRSGSPIYLDIWNVSGPSIMVTQIFTKVNDSQRADRPLRPQVLVEPGKLTSINVAYEVFTLLSESKTLPDLPPDSTVATAHFTVDYFSVAGTRKVDTQCKLFLFVTEKHIAIKTEEDDAS